MAEENERDPHATEYADEIDMVDEYGADALADSLAAQVQAPDPDPGIPVVEVLPPTAAVDFSRPGDVTIDRTQVSVGLGGLSVRRTRMSSAANSEVTQGEAAAVVDGIPQKPVSDGIVTSAAASDAAAEAAQTPSGSVESVQLFTRFLIGAAIYGYDEVLTRLHTFERAIADNPDDYDLTDHLLEQLDEAEDDVDALLRYWAIGMLLWTQRSALQVTDSGFRISLDAGARVLGIAERTTDSFLLRPFFSPVKRVATSLSEATRARIAEGRTVERRDRVLAELTMNDIVSDVIDYVSDNPQLAELVSQQGMGFVSTVMDNGRQIGAISDNAVENLMRKIFRRQRREEIPPSPLAGKAQTMYDPSSEQFNLPKKKKE